MINKGKEYCNGCHNITFINNSAENTQLPSKIADIIFAVQSFHWFDKNSVKEEVKRILKHNGYFAIVWNDWEDENNEFSTKFKKLVEKSLLVQQANKNSEKLTIFIYALIL